MTNRCDDTGKTSESIRKERLAEQEAAAEILGINQCEQLDFTDGEIECTDELREQIVRAIRTHKPDAVFTMDPTFVYSTLWNYPNHRDHRVVGQATFDAVYPMARDASSLPHLAKEGLEPHDTATLLMANFENENYKIDVSEWLEKKYDALKAHPSQFGDAEGVIDFVTRRAEHDAQEIGVRYAEGFVKLDIFS